MIKADITQFMGDPDRLFYMIHCYECKHALWQMKILKRFGTHVASTESKPMEGVPPFNRKIEFCPFCEKRYYCYRRQRNSAPSQCYLVKDLNNGILQLI